MAIDNDVIFGDVPGNIDPACVMLPPLDLGVHTLHIGGAACGPDGVPFFAVDVTYQLSITRR